MSNVGWLALVVVCLVCVALLARLRAAGKSISTLSGELATARHTSEQHAANLADAQHTLTAISSASADALLLVDRGRTIVFANPAARLLSERAEAGHTLIEALRIYELERLVDESHDPQTVKSREMTINGRLYRATAQQAGAHVAVMLRDVSDLQRLGRARRDFVTNLSHELRTPLTTIKLLVEAIQGGKPDHVRHDEMLAQIADQTGVLAQIAQEMYDLSLIETGQLPMRLVETSLAPLIDNVLTILRPQAEPAGLVLRNEVPAETEALVDGAQISRVLANLINNAIKFTVRGSVTVLVQPAAAHDDTITIGVRDTGIGIPLDQQTRIFERFYKVDRARGQRGTGLGLAICKHIVDAHGGRIWVQSLVGTGSTFWFGVPRTCGTRGPGETGREIGRLSMDML